MLMRANFSNCYIKFGASRFVPERQFTDSREWLWVISIIDYTCVLSSVTAPAVETRLTAAWPPHDETATCHLPMFDYLITCERSMSNTKPETGQKPRQFTNESFPVCLNRVLFNGQPLFLLILSPLFSQAICFPHSPIGTWKILRPSSF